MSDQAKKSQNGKDVIYVDVDEEITGVIDRVRASNERIVALVLPKRATVFQSVVNMKLLKRTADEAKKHVVLITSEAGLLPLAGSVGVRIAKSLQSKPEIPDAPEKPDDQPEAVNEAEDVPIDTHKSLAELNGDEEETIELDDIDEENPAEASGATTNKTTKGKNKKLKIPNFNRFRLLVLGGGAGLVVLIVLLVMAFTVLPKAQIVIKTDSQAIDVSQDVSFKVGESVVLDLEKAIVPAHKEEVQKEIAQEVPATGQLNNGEKATGQVTLTLTDCSKPQVTIPGGSGLSSGGRTFITQKSVTLLSTIKGGKCQNDEDASAAVAVTAQTGGAAGNIGPSSFTVAGYSNVTGQSGNPMTGGTDNIIKVISQADIDSAKQKIGSQDVESVKQELRAALQTKGLRPVDSTLSTATPETKQSANAGDQAESVTVTQKVAYGMLGIKEDDLEKLVAHAVKDKIDTQKQSILDYGLADASLALLMTTPDGATLGLHATVVAGPDLDANKIKQQVVGKKANDAEELIKEYPGVTDVRVSYSPFWVSSIPGKASKVTVIIEKPEASEDTDAQSSE